MSGIKKLEDKYLPSTTTKDETIDRPELHLEPIAIKFAQLRMMVTSRSDEEIARSLNVDMVKVRKWKKNKYFIAYSAELKMKIVDQDVHETLKKHHLSLLDKNYIELESRYEDPFSEKNLDILNKLDGAAQKEKFLDRFAYFASHDKLSRTHNEGAKSLRMLLPDNIEGVQEVRIKETIHNMRNTYEDYRQVRIQRERALKESGAAKSESPFAYNKASSRRKEPEIVDADVGPVEVTTTVTEFSIVNKRRIKNGEEEED